MAELLRGGSSLLLVGVLACAEGTGTSSDRLVGVTADFCCSSMAYGRSCSSSVGEGLVEEYSLASCQDDVFSQLVVCPANSTSLSWGTKYHVPLGSVSLCVVPLQAVMFAGSVTCA